MTKWSALAEPGQAAAMASIRTRINDFIAFQTELVRLSREATAPEAHAYADGDAPRANRSALNQEIAVLAADNGRIVQQLTDDISSFYQHRRYVLMGIATFGIAGSVVLAVPVVGLTVTDPIKRVTEAMRALAGGRTDLTIPDIQRRDEIGEMARAADVFLRWAIAVR